MDWLERLFGWRPDGGSGATEWIALYVTVLLVALALLVLQRLARKWTRQAVRRYVTFWMTGLALYQRLPWYVKLMDRLRA